MRKKTLRATLSLLLLVGIFVTGVMGAHAIDIQPRYTGISSITSGLTISSIGGATCSGKVLLRSGYTADLTVELKRDGTTIKTWTSSGSERVAAGGTYYVTTGHEYVVTTTADVYDASGKLIESPSKDSLISDY